MYVVVNIGCIECGVSSNIVGVFDLKEAAETVVQYCEENFSWRDGGQNSFEIFLLPEFNVLNPEYIKE